VYNNAIATEQHPIQMSENPTPAAVISVDAAHIGNAILREYLPSKEVLEDPEIGRTDPNIQIDKNCTDDKPQDGMPGGSRNYEDQGDESDKHHVIPTACQGCQTMTEPQNIDLGFSHVDRFDGDNGDNADAQEEGEASQADDGSTHNVED
jgi:hypothetical protein